MGIEMCMIDCSATKDHTCYQLILPNTLHPSVWCVHQNTGCASGTGRKMQASGNSSQCTSSKPILFRFKSFVEHETLRYNLPLRGEY